MVSPLLLDAYLTNLSYPGDLVAEAAGPSRPLDLQIPLEDENANIEELLCYWVRQLMLPCQEWAELLCQIHQ
jgi:hypothetical protein